MTQPFSSSFSTGIPPWSFQTLSATPFVAATADHQKSNTPLPFRGNLCDFRQHIPPWPLFNNIAFIQPESTLISKQVK